MKPAAKRAPLPPLEHGRRNHNTQSRACRCNDGPCTGRVCRGGGELCCGSTTSLRRGAQGCSSPSPSPSLTFLPRQGGASKGQQGGVGRAWPARPEQQRPQPAAEHRSLEALDPTPPQPPAPRHPTHPPTPPTPPAPASSLTRLLLPLRLRPVGRLPRRAAAAVWPPRPAWRSAAGRSGSRCGKSQWPPPGPAPGRTAGRGRGVRGQIKRGLRAAPREGGNGGGKRPPPGPGPAR